jgi:hypothetical protein
MGVPREERLAKNEALFREGNERMAAWEERHVADPVERYLCECAEEACREKVELHKDEYERVRSNSRWFVLVPGHEIPDVETVIERNEGWAIIEKDPQVTPLMNATDPRRDG